MTIKSITPDKVTFNGNREMYQYEIQEWLDCYEHTTKLSEVMKTQTSLLHIAHNFPFICSVDEQHLIEGNPFKYMSTTHGRKIVSLNDVLSWVMLKRVDEVQRLIDLAAEYDDRYCFIDAAQEVAHRYFDDQMQVYLIWNV